MPPRRLVDSTIYIVDCSKDVINRLYFLYKIFGVKFFHKTAASKQDIQKVILLNCPNFDGIKIVNDWSVYNLDRLEDIEELFREEGECLQTKSFIDAINEAIECFKEDVIEPDNSKRIVLITDLSSSISSMQGVDRQAAEIREQLHRHNIWLYVIGPSVKMPQIKCKEDISKLVEATPTDELSLAQKQNFEVLRRILKNEMGMIVDHDVGIDLLFSYKIKQKKHVGWYVDMQIGKKIKLKVALYKTVRDHPKLKINPCPLIPGTDVDLQKAWYDSATHEEVRVEEVASGYSFHEKFVVFTDEQKRNMKPPPNPKCLSIFAFVNAKEVSKLYFAENSMNMIRADIRSPGPWKRELSAFIASMRKLQVVALAKRVYNNGYLPHLCAIFPCPEHKFGCLLLVDLPFSHEIRQLYTPSEAQVKVKLEDSELKHVLHGFLDNMTADLGNNGNAIIPLPEYMRHDRNRLYGFEYVARCNLGHNPPERPKFQPHPVLIERSSEYYDVLTELCREKESDANE